MMFGGAAPAAELQPFKVKGYFMKRTPIQAFVSLVLLSTMSIAFGEAGIRFEYPVYAAWHIEESDIHQRPELGFSATIIAGGRDFFWSFGFSPVAGALKDRLSMEEQGIQIQGTMDFSHRLYMAEVGFGGDVRLDAAGSPFFQLGMGMGSGSMEMVIDYQMVIPGRGNGYAHVVKTSDRAFGFSFFGGGGYRKGMVEFFTNIKYTWFNYYLDPYEYTVYLDDGGSFIAPVENTTKEGGGIFQVNAGIGLAFGMKRKT
jgi:hypothetical protein